MRNWERSGSGKKRDKNSRRCCYFDKTLFTCNWQWHRRIRQTYWELWRHQRKLVGHVNKIQKWRWVPWSGFLTIRNPNHFLESHGRPQRQLSGGCSCLAKIIVHLENSLPSSKRATIYYIAGLIIKNIPVVSDIAVERQAIWFPNIHEPRLPQRFLGATVPK